VQSTPNTNTRFDIAKAAEVLGNGHLIAHGDRNTQVLKDVSCGAPTKMLGGISKRARVDG
jgi:hypothetical protein